VLAVVGRHDPPAFVALDDGPHAEKQVQLQFETVDALSGLFDTELSGLSSIRHVTDKMAANGEPW